MILYLPNTNCVMMKVLSQLCVDQLEASTPPPPPPRHEQKLRSNAPLKHNSLLNSSSCDQRMF